MTPFPGRRQRGCRLGVDIRRRWHPRVPGPRDMQGRLPGDADGDGGEVKLHGGAWSPATASQFLLLLLFSSVFPSGRRPAEMGKSPNRVGDQQGRGGPLVAAAWEGGKDAAHCGFIARRLGFGGRAVAALVADGRDGAAAW
jgi:hypothetical protein